MISAAALIAEARSWVGVPFLHQGRNRHGVDCAGLLICTYTAVGGAPPFPPPADYRRRPQANSRTMYDICQTNMEVLQGPEPACVVLFKWRGFNVPTHAGMCTGATLIHAYSTVGRVCEVTFGEPWTKLAHSFYRLPGVSQ